MLEPNERALIKGIVINKFRGQRSLLEPGIQWLEERTGIPVIGVIPWMDRNFPSEDSLDLFERRSNRNTGEINIGVIRLPRISNFTDFDPLEAESTVNLQYISPKERLGYPDAVIIPGSKTTIADMLVLQQTGMAEAIREYVAAGGTVLGICGGFQMLGQMLADPEGVEGEEGRFKGLDLLPIKTVIAGQKIARQRVVTSNFPRAGLPVAGYEIHHGRTTLVESSTTQPLFDDSNLGLVNLNQSVWGTYLHGLFDNGTWRRTWLNRLRQQRGIAALPNGIANYRDQREALLDDLAHQIEAHLDLKPILE
uniref:Cobyric acid synthase CobQ n=1 Tax=Desertifilum tharense IPPAS B-1220 TaxID=1781255 RepID=A0ACD5GTZ1_9CYAN